MPTVGTTLQRKLERLDGILDELGRVVVAFSGGADSAFLAARAHRRLGERALAVTAVSPSLAGSEARDCAALAAEWGLAWRTVDTAELERAAYRANDADRCYHCKSELMSVLAPIAAARRATVLLGVNADDLGDHRPGQRAAAEAGARFPMVEADLTKDEIRELSRLLGLRTWDKPAAACLASRIPHGTAVSVSLLSAVERAEEALRALGFGQLRVRHHGEIARIEVPVADLAATVERARSIVAALERLGFRYVTVDLAGFRSGSLNPRRSADQAGEDVDHHPHDHRSEEVREQGVGGDHPPHRR